MSQLNSEKLHFTTCVIYPASQLSFLSSRCRPLTMTRKFSSLLHPAQLTLHIVQAVTIRTGSNLRAVQRFRCQKKMSFRWKKVLTPDCHTIEALANFLGVPK